MVRNMINKGSLSVLIFLLIVLNTHAQGWRENEMEIRVWLQNKTEIEALRAMNLNGDVYTARDTYEAVGIMFVTPEELEKIVAANLHYETIVGNLNEHYKGFWNQRAYYTYEQIIQKMGTLCSTYPTLCMKKIYGTSLGSRELCAIKISDNVTADENEAEIILDGGMHGDEVGGAQNIITLAEDMCSKYATDANIKKLIDSREIWLYCMINPDGRVKMVRYNNNNIDCNRNWGYLTTMTSQGFSEPETRGIRDCLLDHQFSVQVSYHSGIEYILYPWGLYSAPTPDKSHHAQLTKIYSDSSLYTKLEVYQSYTTYYTTGETLDYSYGALGTAALTMEISTGKQPTDMAAYYNKNYKPMLLMIEYAGYGLEGTITDAVTGKPVGAMLYVNNLYPCYSDPVVGDYHKFVIAGTYSIKVVANGYISKTVSNITVENKKSTITNIALEPANTSNSIWGYKTLLIEDGTGITYNMLGPNDGVAYTPKSNNEIVIDMQYAVKNRTGNDFKLHSTTTGSYTFYAGAGVDGPWKSLGTGTTTKEFDLTAGSLESARYIRTVGTGTTNLGFDAVEAFIEPASFIAINNCTPRISATIGINNTHSPIAFFVKSGEPYTLKVFDIHGKLCWQTGRSQMHKNQSWAATGAGMFIARLETGKDVVVKRFNVVK